MLFPQYIEQTIRKQIALFINPNDQQMYFPVFSSPLLYLENNIKINKMKMIVITEQMFKYCLNKILDFPGIY